MVIDCQSAREAGDSIKPRVERGFASATLGTDLENKSSPRSGRKHKAQGGARLCEGNHRIANKKIIGAREAGDSERELHQCWSMC